MEKVNKAVIGGNYESHTSMFGENARLRITGSNIAWKGTKNPAKKTGRSI
jgi:hypothetical protein